MEKNLPIYKAITLILFFSLVSCASNEVRIDNLPRPVAQIQKAIAKAMPLGEPRTNKSKRKFTSKPFLYKGTDFVPPSNSRVRYFSVVEILGDRRPYSILIEVFKTQRLNSEFIVVGKDRYIANVLSKTIQYQLSKGLKNGNAIDDFRVF